MNAAESGCSWRACCARASKTVDALGGKDGTLGKTVKEIQTRFPIRAGQNIDAKQLQRCTTGKDLVARALCYVQCRITLCPRESRKFLISTYANFLPSTSPALTGFSSILSFSSFRASRFASGRLRN